MTDVKTIPKRRFIPLILTACVIAADQITKLIVASRLPFARPVEIIGDFLRFTYVKNPAVAFSLGRNLSADIQQYLFFILPLLVLVGITIYYFTSRELTIGQRWALAAIFGGGLSNLLDRMIRSGGVVDFIDVKFYGIFGLLRWPIFNVADSTVVIAGLFLIITLLKDELSLRSKK